MKLFASLTALALPLCFGSAIAAAWSFEAATLTVRGKGAGLGGGLEEKLTPGTPLSKNVPLTATDTLKIILTTTDGNTGKRPHQAFLTLHEPKTGLEESFPFTLKDSGKGKVELSQKDLPYQFLTADSPITASLVIASFGSSTPYNTKAFSLSVTADPAVHVAAPSQAVRYGKLPEIHHIFKSDPKSPPKVISAFFTLAVVATLPVLLGVWLTLGANVDHVGKAMSKDPVSHGLFFGSIVAMEGIFFLYYTTWNLFQILPAVGIVGAVAVVSGSRALTEVQERRLAGGR